ncbi:GNAT family N-acetyltransferase [Flavobacterium cheongpyeongense]|uniref:GNAT family N-acetyltransferase n=1 Tax=Flavobacterium cheongpyeongense TaxID=2212651 RepID=A0A2V4BJC5_9FLAO|nr:GNAT family N-acetyltransferase [Flavobacterium cheongpyeongense]PXY39068.1 GNAT family N-acetyltransferase [Flavobacterium cheongpyeongense]
MNRYSVKKYTENHYKTWNDFIAQAKNATFLFHRDFMEYHKDRFEDYSLMVFEGGKLVAVLPANIDQDTVYSHQGLTYGGLVYNEKFKLASVIQIFKCILFFLNSSAIQKLQVKLLPSVYHQKPSEELNYALFLSDAQLIRRDTLTVIDLSTSYSLSKIRKRGVKNGISNRLIVKEVDGFYDFWNEILIPNLAQKHQAKPVHSLEEITKLKALFPEKVRQFNVYHNGTIVAGTTVFESSNVAHSQYISGIEDKNELGGIDFLFYILITDVFKNKRFFDFGISNESQGRKLNEGLSYWKESFGASTIVHDFYEVQTSNYSLLNNVLI